MGGSARSTAAHPTVSGPLGAPRGMGSKRPALGGVQSLSLPRCSTALEKLPWCVAGGRRRFARSGGPERRPPLTPPPCRSRRLWLALPAAVQRGTACHLPPSVRTLILPACSSSEADAAAIRAAFDRGGELSAAVELRRLFPAITDTAQARACARTIAGWTPLPVPRHGGPR
jgi:hypothetical protein